MDYTTFYYLNPADDTQLQKAIEVVSAKVTAAESAAGTDGAAATPAP